VFHGGSAKNDEARLLGIAEFGYHPNGLHAVGTWRLAKRGKKNIAKLPEFSKSLEATFLCQAS
jgi:hypothetical protein